MTKHHVERTFVRARAQFAGTQQLGRITVGSLMVNDAGLVALANAQRHQQALEVARCLGHQLCLQALAVHCSRQKKSHNNIDIAEIWYIFKFFLPPFEHTPPSKAKLSTYGVRRHV